MKSITNNNKLLIAFTLIAFGVAFFAFSANNAFAFGDSGNGGCCGGESPGGGNGGGGGGGEYTPPKIAAKCQSLTANKTTVPYGGGNVKLSWRTDKATSVSINNGIGKVNKDDSKTVFVSKTTTFTLTAYGTGGNSTCKVTITVEPPVEKPPAKCLSFTASKSVVHPNGETITLNWNTENISSITINNGGGTFNSAQGSTSVFVNSNITYILTAHGAGGNADCEVTIKVGQEEKPAPKCLSFTASRTTVPYGGANVTLSWNTQNANSVHISNGPGNFNSTSGSTSVFVDSDTTFTLTVYGTHGNETCKVTVRTDDDKEDDKPTPRCELNISKTRVNRGDKVTLSWETRNADSVRIRDDRGNTIFDTSDYRSSDRRRYLNGEVDIIVNQTTEFTMTARGEGGSRTCRVEVRVDDLAVYEKRDQGMVIALTQVPYTGFEAGPFLTFIFYAVLTLWALFIAYILVIKKGTVLGFSLYRRNHGTILSDMAVSEADIENRKKVEALVAKYADRNWN